MASTTPIGDVQKICFFYVGSIVYHLVIVSIMAWDCEHSWEVYGKTKLCPRLNIPEVQSGSISINGDPTSPYFMDIYIAQLCFFHCKPNSFSL